MTNEDFVSMNNKFILKEQTWCLNTKHQSWGHQSGPQQHPCALCKEWVCILKLISDQQHVTNFDKITLKQWAVCISVWGELRHTALEKLHVCNFQQKKHFTTISTYIYFETVPEQAAAINMFNKKQICFNLIDHCFFNFPQTSAITRQP